MSTKLALAALAVSAALVSACAGTGGTRERALATATLLDREGAVRGNAVILGQGGHAALRVEANGLKPGSVHGMHLHAVGRCEPGNFASAGGHLNPLGRQHGTMNPAGSHLGDLPNLSIGADGQVAATVRLDGDPDALLAQVFDADGTAIVIHADADDYRTDPAGNSGARIICGVFAATQ